MQFTWQRTYAAGGSSRSRQSALFLIGAVVSSLFAIGPGHFGEAEAASHRLSPQPRPAAPPKASAAKAQDLVDKIPMAFESSASTPNTFVSHGSDYSVVIGAASATLGIAHYPKRGATTVPTPQTVALPPKPDHNANVTFQLVGANPNAAVTGGAPLPGVSNYLLGNDQSKWRLGVRQYQNAQIGGAYPGIGVTWSGGKDHLEDTFTVAPGANPGRISFIVSGAAGISVDRAGNLIISVPGGEIVEPAPSAYAGNASHLAVPVHYTLKGHTV